MNELINNNNNNNKFLSNIGNSTKTTTTSTLTSTNTKTSLSSFSKSTASMKSNNTGGSSSSSSFGVIKKKELDTLNLKSETLGNGKKKKKEKVSIDTTSDEEFKKLYFFDKDVIKTLYKKLLQVNKKLKEEYLLWALSYLLFKHSHEKKALEYGVSRRTYQSRVWDVFRTISYLKPHRSINDRHKTSIKNIFEVNQQGNQISNEYISLILDTAFFPIASREPQYLNHKKGPGLLYEIGFSPIDGEILYLNGPHPGAYHNIMVFREGYLYDIDFEKDEKVIGTKKHRGEPDKIITPFKNTISSSKSSGSSDNISGSNGQLTNSQIKFNEWLKSKREVSDKVMNVIKHFKISQNAWSSSIEKHQLAISFLLYTINLSILKERSPNLLNEILERNNDIIFDQNVIDDSNTNNTDQSLQSLNNNQQSYQHTYRQQPYKQFQNSFNFKDRYHDNDEFYGGAGGNNDDDDLLDSDEETLENHSDNLFTKNNHLNKPMFFCIGNRAHIERSIN